MLLKAMKAKFGGLPVRVTPVLRSEGWVEVNQVKRACSRQREHHEQKACEEKDLHVVQCGKDRGRGQLVLNFMHWFDEYLMSTYYDPGTVLDAEKQQWTKQSSSFSQDLQSSRGDPMIIILMGETKCWIKPLQK